MAIVVVMPIFQRRTVSEWALNPDAPRGYFSGEQDPGGPSGDGLFTISGVPSAGFIEVHHAGIRGVVASTFAAADGTWRIDDLPSQDVYTIVGRDPSGAVENVIVSGQVPYT